MLNEKKLKSVLNNRVKNAIKNMWKILVLKNEQSVNNPKKCLKIIVLKMFPVKK